MINRDEAIRGCFAFNEAGQRCDMPAGHPGKHAITMSWTDEECWQPGRTVTIKALDTPTLGGGGGGMQSLPLPEPQKCAICDHPYHVVNCPVGSCDCASGIPE